MSKKPKLPLYGMRVLDLSYVFAVPYMAGLMSDLGAEVIKIEGPHRLDLTRRGAFGPYLDNELGSDPWNRSGTFHVVNRGKQSLVLDMNKPEGREVFLQLVHKSDVVLDNYTPRVMRKWGLHYEALRKHKRSLIMLSNTGYGPTGPWSQYPSQGTTLEATMGITNYTGYRNDKPWKVGQSYPDLLACWAGLCAFFAALRHQRKTGEGQWIDLGMYQVGAAMIPEPLLQKQVNGSEPQRIGNEHLDHVPSNVYPAHGDDRWVAITVTSDRQWQELACLMGQDGIETDGRFRQASVRRQQREEVDRQVAAWTCQRAPLELLNLLQFRGIACGPVFNNRDLLLDEHLRQRGFYERVEHAPPIGPRPIIGRPYRLRFRDARIRKPAPRFGEDSRAILSGLLGMRDEQITSLLASKIVCEKPTNPEQVSSLDIDEALRIRTFVEFDRDYRQKLNLDEQEP